MRISDWSSDVCSSDLEGLAAVAVPVRLKSGRTVAALNCSSLTRRLDNDNTLQQRAALLQRAAQRVSEAVQMIPSLGASQIGRAHVCTPVTNAHLLCRLLLEKKKQ